MRLLFHILILPIFILVCAVVMMWLPLPDFLPPALSRGRNQLAAVVTGVLFMGNLVWTALYVIGSLLQHSRAVDEAFSPLGLEGQSYLLFGRQYHGLVEGRQVDVTFVKGRWSATLNIYVVADIDTRVAIGAKRPLLDCRECPRLSLGDSDLRHVQIFAQDEAWTRGLLADLEARGALSRLMAGQKSLGQGELYLQPGRIWLNSHPSRVDAAAFGQWFEDLMTLVKALSKF